MEALNGQVRLNPDRGAGTDWDAVRAELWREPAPGLNQAQKALSIEATIREGQAAEEGHPFYFEDVERELEDIYASVGAAPSGIINAKAKVLTAARETARKTGCDLRMALFYCYSESIQTHREHLATTRAQPKSSSLAASSSLRIQPMATIFGFG